MSKWRADTLVFSVKCLSSVDQSTVLSVTNHYIVNAAAFSEINYGWCICYICHIQLGKLTAMMIFVIKGNITHYNDHIVTRDMLLLPVEENKSEFVSFVTWNHPLLPRVIIISRM